MTKKEIQIIDKMVKNILDSKRCSQPNELPGNGVDFYIKTLDVCNAVNEGMKKLKAL